MALGDVVRDECGNEYVVIWDGGPESAPLLEQHNQRPQPINERSVDARSPQGSDRRLLRKWER